MPTSNSPHTTVCIYIHPTPFVPPNAHHTPSKHHNTPPPNSTQTLGALAEMLLLCTRLADRIGAHMNHRPTNSTKNHLCTENCKRIWVVCATADTLSLQHDVRYRTVRIRNVRYKCQIPFSPAPATDPRIRAIRRSGGWQRRLDL